MIQAFTINTVELQVDAAKTREFYLTQHRIEEECKCEDCAFYAKSFINNDLEIFRILNAMGVDLGRNLATEPTGVWCIRDDNGNFLHCQQVYQVIGSFSTGGTLKVSYEKTENDLKIDATIIRVDDEKMRIELQISA